MRQSRKISDEEVTQAEVIKRRAERYIKEDRGSFEEELQRLKALRVRSKKLFNNRKAAE